MGLKRRRMLASTLAAAGVLLLTVGFALVYLPAGVIVAGAALLLFGLLGVEVDR